MRRFAVAALLMAPTVLTSFVAAAQGNDPFRPPPGAGFSPGGSAEPGPASDRPPVLGPSNPGAGLANTGQDVGLLLWLAMAMLCLGPALKMIARMVERRGTGDRLHCRVQA